MLRRDNDELACSTTVLCAECVRQTGVTGASVSLMSHGGAQITLHATDFVVAGLAETLRTLRQGPAVEAFEHRTVVLAENLADERSNARWPLYASQALNLGAHAVLCFPLVNENSVRGVLELYRDRPGPLSSAGVRFATGTAAALNLRVCNLGFWPDAINEFDLTILEDVYEDMAAVHQATGMLAARLGMSTSQAAARLQAHAFAKDRSLTSVARDILAEHARHQRHDGSRQPEVD